MPTGAFTIESPVTLPFILVLPMSAEFDGGQLRHAHCPYQDEATSPQIWDFAGAMQKLPYCLVTIQKEETSSWLTNGSGTKSSCPWRTGKKASEQTNKHQENLFPEVRLSVLFYTKKLPYPKACLKDMQQQLGKVHGRPQHSTATNMSLSFL